MATTSDLRRGQLIRYNGSIHRVIEYEHISPGNWRAFVRLRLKNFETGKIVEDRVRAGSDIEIVTVDTRPAQFLYSDGIGFHFLDQETFETVTLNGDLIGEDRDFLADNVLVQIHRYNGNPIGLQFPPHVELTVASTEPAVRGDTASGGVTKLATLETGLEIRVPLFIKEGEKVRVHTETREFGGRAG